MSKKALRKLKTRAAEARTTEIAKMIKKAKVRLDAPVSVVLNQRVSGPLSVAELLDCAKKAVAEADNRIMAIKAEQDVLSAENGVLVQRAEQARAIVHALEAAGSLCGAEKV